MDRFKPAARSTTLFTHARNGAIYATSNDSWFGSEIVRSSDLGKFWETSDRNPGFAEGRT